MCQVGVAFFVEGKPKPVLYDFCVNLTRGVLTWTKSWATCEKMFVYAIVQDITKLVPVMRRVDVAFFVYGSSIPLLGDFRVNLQLFLVNSFHCH